MSKYIRHDNLRVYLIMNWFETNRLFYPHHKPFEHNEKNNFTY
jgi:hypothetical protein